jgi:hypothetical protein
MTISVAPYLTSMADHLSTAFEAPVFINQGTDPTAEVIGDVTTVFFVSIKVPHHNLMPTCDLRHGQHCKNVQP